MKKVMYLLLILLICFGCFGCNEQNAASSEETPPASTQQTEPLFSLPDLPQEAYDVDYTEGYIMGNVVEQYTSNILLVKTSYFAQEDGWPEYIYVIMKTPDKFYGTEGIGIYYYLTQKPHDPAEYPRVYANLVECYGLPGAKPILYFYPEVPTDISVQLTLNGRFTSTYPAYGATGWQGFTAYPDGTLLSSDGKSYYALYWEGMMNTVWDFSEGWCVPGEETVTFLEWALAAQGLSPREANEFIIYWLPILQENPYNVISFQTTAYTEAALLEVTPAPDSLLRIFMAYYVSETPVELPPQMWDGFERTGFTVVEWGGGESPAPQ